MEQLLSAAGYEDPMFARMIEPYVKELPTSANVQHKKAVLVMIEGFGLNKPEHAIELLEQLRMRCPTERECFSFLAAYPEDCSQYEIHAVGHKEIHRCLGAWTYKGEKHLFGVIWLNGPVVANNACLLAMRK